MCCVMPLTVASIKMPIVCLFLCYSSYVQSIVEFL